MGLGARPGWRGGGSEGPIDPGSPARGLARQLMLEEKNQ
jgi:hypothetical protein